MMRNCRCGISIAVLFALALLGAAPALGATHTWIGPTNGVWSNAANWSGGSKPTSGEAGGTIVQFGANTTSTMDIAGLVVDQIHFTGANNTVNGSAPLTINGSTLIDNIVSEGPSNTLGATLHVATAGAALLATSSAGTLTIAGIVSGTLGLVFEGSGGEFALTGSNTYTGPTTIVSGALHIATPVGYVIVGSSITIGDGLGHGAELVLDQSSDISPETAVTVESDGVFNFKGEIDTAKSLTVNGGRALVGTLTMSGPLLVNDGTITISGVLSAGSLSMTGGTISGSGLLALSGNIQATSSPAGPATVASPVQLKASPTVTVTPGVAPELRVTGIVSETGGSRSITKTGTGTMLTSASNTYTGTTTISEGTLIANGSQVGAVLVGPSGTLGGSGTVGATTVAGILAPTAPGLNTGTLSFGATGRLDVTLTSVAPVLIPTVIATGPVAIDPTAALNLVVAPGSVVPRGSSVVLIDNGGTEPIGGQFTGVASGSVLSTVEGVPLVVSYIGGDGNDLTLTAPNLSTTGNGTSAASASPTPTAGATEVPTGTGSAATSTTKSSGYGADFSLTVPSICVRAGTPFSVTLNVTKRRKAKIKGNVLVKVTRVVFAIGTKIVKTDRSTPFRIRLTVPRTATSGSTIKLGAKAYLKLHGGKRRAKSITVAVKVC
ncbi:MAG TPA: autotransporter-associated beta strand repeat-containing protein [Solirubrobacteraceae bacterium]|nr:autotransporter-associated beta strand repeat-containing protein [Solirubrobacteraceae bacterium]